SGGAVTGKLLPTGKVKEDVKFPRLGTLTVSMVDAANPFVFVRATDLGMKDDATSDQIAADEPLLKKCEEIRSVVAEIMGIGKEREAKQKRHGVPQLTPLSPPR